jgi:CheY-like chemotaxis protein
LTEKNLNNITILLAEDIKLNQIVVKKMIEKLNGYVDIAQNGIEVISMIKKRKYDVILMDLHMPEMDGYEATKLIKGHIKYHSQIIIGLSAEAQHKHKVLCLNIGMNDYITKPFKATELVKKIQKLVNQVS